MTAQSSMSTTESTKKTRARVVREFGPFDGKDQSVHGVTFDGKLVWFARNDELVALDPETGAIERRLDVPGAAAGTAFDGENIYQLAGAEIIVVRPSDGHVLRRLPAPGKGKDSGMAWSDGFLWIGQWREGKINKVDAKTGEVVKTLSSDRWVTGVSCVDGAIWHGAQAQDGSPTEIRRLGPDGTIEEALVMPEGISVSGIEGTQRGRFFAGGGQSGRIRIVER